MEFWALSLSQVILHKCGRRHWPPYSTMAPRLGLQLRLRLSSVQPEPTQTFHVKCRDSRPHPVVCDETLYFFNLSFYNLLVVRYACELRRLRWKKNCSDRLPSRIKAIILQCLALLNFFRDLLYVLFIYKYFDQSIICHWYHSFDPIFHILIGILGIHSIFCHYSQLS